MYELPHGDPRAMFLTDIALALFFAVAVGAIAARFGISRIVGYIIAGILVGPFTPGVVVRTETVENLAELGLIFLLFSLGLSFSFKEIRAAGMISTAGNIVVMALLGAASAVAAWLAHLPHPYIVGLATVLSSTAIGVTLLRDWGVERTRAAQLAVGLLVVQDLVAVVLLVIVATPPDRLSPAGIVWPIGKALVFIAVALAVGARVLHWFVTRSFANTPSEALFGAFAAVALISGFLAYVVGLPYEFGAFMAGAVISEGAGSERVAHAVMPFRALFVSLFFVAIGMAVNPVVVFEHWPIVFGLGIALFLVRALLWTALGGVAGLGAGAALLFGVALIPLGEFNIVLANTAFAASSMNGDERSILVGIAFFSIIGTTLCAPLFRHLCAATRSR
jgi:CPA2 family monovalent cation:H+ antiporter-2